MCFPSAQKFEGSCSSSVVPENIDIFTSLPSPLNMAFLPVHNQEIAVSEPLFFMSLRKILTEISLKFGLFLKRKIGKKLERHSNSQVVLWPFKRLHLFL